MDWQPEASHMGWQPECIGVENHIYASTHAKKSVTQSTSVMESGQLVHIGGRGHPTPAEKQNKC